MNYRPRSRRNLAGLCTHDESRLPISQSCSLSQPPAGHQCPRPRDRHDCDYVDAINRLIPLAALHADNALGNKMPEGVEERKKWRDAWDRTYFAEMDRLAEGLRGKVRQ